MLSPPADGKHRTYPGKAKPGRANLTLLRRFSGGRPLSIDKDCAFPFERLMKGLRPQGVNPSDVLLSGRSPAARGGVIYCPAEPCAAPGLRGPGAG